MNSPGRTRFAITSAGLIACAAFLVPLALAQDQPTQPPPATPLLQQLSAETQRVFADVRQHLVVVQLPAPRWMNQAADHDDPLSRWSNRLDPRTRQALERERHDLAAGTSAPLQAYVEQSPAQPATPDSTSPDADDTQPDRAVDRIFGPRVVGLLLDSQRALIPVFIDRDAIGQTTIQITTSDGQIQPARIIGADRRTDLTLLGLQDAPATAPAAHPTTIPPLRLADHPPQQGSLVLLVASAAQGAQLVLWNGGLQQRGLVVDLTGAVVGLSRPTMYIGADDLRVTVDELTRFGHVRRAVLGVAVELAPEPDGHTAIQVDQVQPQSPAAQAGLQEGDLLLAIGDRQTPDMPSLAAAIVARQGPTTLLILRGHTRLTLSITLTAQ